MEKEYSIHGYIVGREAVSDFAKAIYEEINDDLEMVPSIFSTMYCLYPLMAQVFADKTVGVELAGLIHVEQSFEWPYPVHIGDQIDSTARIVSMQHRRSIAIIEVAMESHLTDGTPVCVGSARFISNGGSSL